MPLDLRPKKTRKIRQALKAEQKYARLSGKGRGSGSGLAIFGPNVIGSKPLLHPNEHLA